MSDTPLRDALAKIADEGLDLTVSDKAGEDPAATLAFQKRLGKGWSWQGAVTYVRDTVEWYTGLSWRPKP